MWRELIDKDDDNLGRRAGSSAMLGVCDDYGCVKYMAGWTPRRMVQLLGRDGLQWWGMSTRTTM